MRQVSRGMGAITLLVLCTGVFAGFGGRLHPFGDSLSLLRIPLGVICVIGLVFRMPMVLRVCVGCAAALALMTTVPMLATTRGDGTLLLYSKNLLYRNDALPALAADIIASDADVVTLQEVGQRNDVFLAMMADHYPYQHLCRFSGWSGIAVLSKTPFVADARCSIHRGVAVAQIEKDGQAVWVASVHLPWPYPYDHARSAGAATALLGQLAGAIVVAGDFNIFPWASTTHQIRQVSGTRIAGPLRPTYDLYGLPLFLDHVYSPGGGHVTYRDRLGSDHLGVLAQLSLDH
ncbi:MULTISPECIES: endonuclease/exonuclease/phosphatase family protein [Rhodobacterales]|uniref:endonuclease/exonuclease/phosphatase family protein n=1 Tax=Rhodobacterales TaxID=204455 RepID=UPI0015F00304|nr:MULTISPECIES: endonuclease/exonuclease/phosphatase family protein [Rhodobacterales]MDO6589747.1 endonuclease/exonuclease/phosphatase family protein [Yoonia sp. 1_MG-2023]